MPAAARHALIGRRDELAVARRLVDALPAGGGTVLVTGEAGIGKSRLLLEIADLATAADVAVLSGRAVAGGGTFRPLAEAVARVAVEISQLPDADAVVAGLENER